MPRYKMIVMSNPVEGREAEYNDWYQNVHLDEVVKLKGFTSARRFRLARSLTERETWPYAAIYEIETDDVDAVLQRLRDAAASGRLKMSESLATALAYATVYEEFGPVVTR